MCLGLLKKKYSEFFDCVRYKDLLELLLLIVLLSLDLRKSLACQDIFLLLRKFLIIFLVFKGLPKLSLDQKLKNLKPGNEKSET